METQRDKLIHWLEYITLHLILFHIVNLTNDVFFPSGIKMFIPLDFLKTLNASS